MTRRGPSPSRRRREKHQQAQPVHLGQAWPGLIPYEARDILLPAGYEPGSEALVHRDRGVITTTPLLPLEEIFDLDTSEHHYRVRRLKRGVAEDLTLPATALRDQRRIVGLAAHGVDVDTRTADSFGRFLREYLRLNRLPQRWQTRRLGWRPHARGGGYVLHQCHPPDPLIGFIGETEDAKTLVAGLRPTGTIEGWRALFLEVLPFHFVATTVLAACLPPVREILDLEIPSFILDLAAQSSSGKTVAQAVGLSVWAYPESPAWLCHGHATYAGLEAICLRTHGLPVFVQDVHLVSEEARRAFIYGVGNETFKARGGERRRMQAPWRGVVLTSGEVPLVSEASLAGEGARVLSLHGLPFGEISGTIRRLIDEILRPGLLYHHGTVGPALVNHLLGLSEMDKGYLRATWEGYRDKVAASAEGSPILARQAAPWAGLYLTADILDSFLALGKKQDLHLAVTASYTQAKEIQGARPTRRAQELLVGEGYASEAYCYQWKLGGYDLPKKHGRVVGAINHQERTVALYRPIAEEVLRRNGFSSPSAVLEAMRSEGLLVSDRGHLTSRVQLAGGRRRMIVIRLHDQDEGE